MNMLTTWPAGDVPDDDQPALAWLDHWLRSDTDVDAPTGFAARVAARIEADERRLTPWRQALGAIGMVLSGVLLVAWTAVQLASQWHAALEAAPMAGAVLDAGRGLAAALLALGGAPGAMAGRAAVYALAAIGMAALWFGATVAPRAVPQGAAARRRS